MITRFTSRLFVLVALCVSLGAAYPLLGQTNVNPNRVTFYTEPNFRGEALMVEAGATVADLSQMTRPSNKPWVFAISSVLVEGDAKVTVYTAPGFQGERLEITRSISDLYGELRRSGGTWDRAIASASVTGSRVMPATPTPAPRYEEPPPSVVVVPRHVAPPPPVRAVRPMDIRAIDAAIHRAYREVLNRPADPEGLRLYRARILHEGWSEAQMIAQLQRSEEARGVDANAAITRAYREVLGRDPDPSGLAHYRAKWREGWTQGQIRDDLRRSVEGRGNHIHSAITRAYRELLGRDPDPAGYANYERLMRERGYSERDVRAAIMSGDEYRQRRGRR
jgi:hypothetical protein